MKKFRFLFLLVIMLAAGEQLAHSQGYPVHYRPPHQQWQQLSIPHFRIIFPRGQDSVAYKAAHILENQYPKVQNFVGGGLSDFPVILNGYNDLSNGFVTPFHFRSEVEIAPEKGKTENPINGGWLQNVLPHELTHAVHFSHLGGVGLARLVSFFSPDLARSLHGAAPSGILEGLAVYHESHGVTPHGGRGHYPFFTNQFNAVFNSSKRWSMGQMVQRPAYTRPFGRYYIGGYEFTNWLQQTYGSKTSRDAIDFHIRWPFLGYGIALKHATGQWPGQLYHQFVHDKKKQLSTKNNRFSHKKYKALPISYHGPNIRRPKWLSDSTLIFHGSFYNAQSGFYRYNINNHSMKRIITTGVVSGYNYTLSGDKKTFIYSNYNPNLIYPSDFKATLVKVSLPGGHARTIKHPNRLFDPAFASDSTLFALKTFHTVFKLVKMSQRNSTNHLVRSLFSNPGAQLTSVAVDPQNSDSLAVVINKDGNQSLWIASENRLKSRLKSPPTISFAHGSIFDPVWHPDGKRLLFSADFTGTLQVYEYSLKTGAITQITRAPYNAFEASYSPDGNRIAFIIQRKNERLPVVLSRNNFYDKKITNESGTVTPPGLKVASTKKPSWQQRPYQTGASWLKPRTVIPVIKKISGSNRYRFGAGIYSSDLLANQAYSADGTITGGRLWYNATYRNKQFFPGFKARIYSRPAFRRFTFKNTKGQTFSQTFLRQERGVALSVPMQFTFRQNVSYSSLYVEPEIRESQIRYFNRKGDNPSDFSHSAIGNIYAQLDFKLQQDIRSVQPNSGLVLYSEFEHYFSSKNLMLETKAGEASLPLRQPTAFKAGLFGYLSPLRRWNESLRLGIEAITQNAPDFDNQSIVSNGFDGQVFPFSNHLVSFSGRYTIPLFYPDNGGLLIPLYLSNVYLVGFANSVVNTVANRAFHNARTVVGGGLRVQFRLSNLSFDVGVGIGYEPSRDKTHIFVGSF